MSVPTAWPVLCANRCLITFPPQHLAQMVAYGTPGSLKHTLPLKLLAPLITLRLCGPRKELVLCCILVTYLLNGSGRYKYHHQFSEFCFYYFRFVLKCVNNELRHYLGAYWLGGL